MNWILDAFAGMTLAEASFWALVENIVLFLAAVGSGHLILLAFRDRLVGPPPPPVERREVTLALSCVVGNTVVTVVGWWLWRRGFLVIRRESGWRAWFDAGVLLLLMDLGMYVSHRLAHLPAVYSILHATHHSYVRPRPLDLFVLNPLEVFGFGALWLSVMWVYPASWLGILIYLTLNVAFGTIGHLGVEPFPRTWADRWGLGLVGTSTFHAGHHHARDGNFGFYTLIWDRLFGTLDPEYRDRFRVSSGGASCPGIPAKSG